MPRQTPLDNIGPNDLAYEIGGTPAAGFRPSLVVVTVDSQAGSSADKIQLTASVSQVDGNGRPVLGADGNRVKIVDAVDEFPRDSFLYQHRRDVSMAAATRFESAGMAIPQPIDLPTPAGLVPEAPAPAAEVSASTPTSATTLPGATPLPATPAAPVPPVANVPPAGR